MLAISLHTQSSEVYVAKHRILSSRVFVIAKCTIFVILVLAFERC